MTQFHCGNSYVILFETYFEYAVPFVLTVLKTVW